jgi:hypothetical protein
VAEQALYRSIHNPSSKCIETLATNPEKAGFVRFLLVTMEFEDDQHRAISYLLNALVNMHSLSDLRLAVPKPWTESLNKILWSVYEPNSFDPLKTNCWRHSSNVHFRLQTLYCNAFLDLSQIVKSQTELQILGIYNWYRDSDRAESEGLGTFKQLQSAQLHLPVIVAFGRDSYWLNVFPAFYSIDRCPSIYQALAESFDKLGEGSLYTFKLVFGLSIYLVDSCDMPSIHVLTRNMATRLPELVWLNFCFENPCEIVSFLLSMIVLELKSICVISAITGDKENHLFIPLSE